MSNLYGMVTYIKNKLLYESLYSLIEANLRYLGYDSSGYEIALKNPDVIRNLGNTIAKFSSTKFGKTEDAIVYEITNPNNGIK